MRITEDRFNSEFFGFKMGNLEYSQCENKGEAEIQTILMEAKAEGYRHLTIRIPSEEKELLVELCRNGFYLTDTTYNLVFERGTEATERKSEVVCRPFTEEDVTTLIDIAGYSFGGGRYHADPNLDNDSSDRYYQKWLENSFKGFAEGVMVAELRGEVCGFFSYNVKDGAEYGVLVLGAVDSKFRGKGVFPQLIRMCTDTMLEKHLDIKGVLVGTQLTNVSAIRSYGKAGFKYHSSSFVLHYYE